jgi:hypothetical protein
MTFMKGHQYTSGTTPVQTSRSLALCPGSGRGGARRRQRHPSNPPIEQQLRLLSACLKHPIYADDVCMPMTNQLSATVLLFFLLGSISAQNLDAPTALKMGQTGANTFVGMVSDSSCGARHKMMDKSAEECARTCQRAGASYVLVAGEKIYTLAGRANDLAYLAGQKVKVTGSARGNTISVTAVAPIR